MSSEYFDENKIKHQNAFWMDIMTRLFDLDLDLVLQMIFISLDPRSLHTSKQVCKQWHKFINSRIWRNKSMKKILRHKLEQQWKNGLPSAKTFPVESYVSDIRSDKDIIVAGIRNGTVMVLDKKSGSVMFSLNHQDGSWIQVDFSVTLIVSASDRGSVMVWKRRDGTLIQKMTHHGNRPVWGVSVVGNRVLTCGVDHSLAILQYCPQNNEVKLLHQLYDHHTSINHVDSDQTWALTGTRSGMKLWNIEEAKCVRTIPSEMIHSLALQYPMAATVGDQDDLGVHVWDVQNGILIRTILQTYPMREVRIFGSYLVSTTLVAEHISDIFIWNLKEIVDLRVTEKNLWYRDFKCRVKNVNGFSCVSIDERCLILSECYQEHQNTITLRDFWLSD